VTPARTQLTLCLAGPTTAPSGNHHKVNGQGKAATGTNEKRSASGGKRRQAHQAHGDIA
jgi:hypothetical protein